jgi:hypothetical protein
MAMKLMKVRNIACVSLVLVVASCGEDPGDGWSWGDPGVDSGQEAPIEASASEDALPTSPESGAESGTDVAPEATPSDCGCLLGEGPYCAARAKAEAAAAQCTIELLDDHPGDLLKCENDAWTVLETCSGACDYDGTSAELDDACVLPECDCFVQVAWCGSGAGKKAATLGCQIPLLPEHDGDILYCPGGVWSVKTPCELGCVEAPDGTPDYCKDNSEYRAPWTCGQTYKCTSGNHTSNHDGKDEYAYDFGMPVGTVLRAMRPGTVLRARYVSKPGDPCYNGGGSACANYANTVEIKHADGTVALYMHLSTLSVSAGAHVERGDVLGKSGNSGWSTGPHVHVQVQKDCGIWWCQSIPFEFADSLNVVTGTLLTSQNCP